MILQQQAHSLDEINLVPSIGRSDKESHQMMAHTA